MSPRNPQTRNASRCRVCGADAGLTFQHPPPTSAFNIDPPKVFGLEDWLGRGRAEREQPGAYTLCPACNDNAAAWYVPEFAEWRRAGAELIADGPSDADLGADPRPTWTTAELFDVRPARFVKQVVTMLLAIAPAGFVSGDHAELGEYARDPKHTGLPDAYQLYLTLYRGPFARFVGYSAQIDTETQRSEELLELAYPPFSCVLSLAGEADIETTNISGFAELSVDESCIVDLDLLNGFGHTPFPADFRTLAAVERDREADSRAA
jgi:hypothetical protein